MTNYYISISFAIDLFFFCLFFGDFWSVWGRYRKYFSVLCADFSIISHSFIELFDAMFADLNVSWTSSSVPERLTDAIANWIVRPQIGIGKQKKFKLKITVSLHQLNTTEKKNCTKKFPSTEQFNTLHHIIWHSIDVLFRSIWTTLSLAPHQFIFVVDSHFFPGFVYVFDSL